MKVYLLDTHGNGRKYFEDEDSLISTLMADKVKGHNVDRYNITVLEANVESSASGIDYLSSFSDKNIRESKLSAVLGDDYAQKVDTLRNLVMDLATDSKLKSDFISKMNTISVDKKVFGKFISNNSNYLLYQVSNSVEWYESLLSVYSFRKIDDYYIRNFGKCKTPEINKQNFLIAKAK